MQTMTFASLGDMRPPILTLKRALRKVNQFKQRMRHRLVGGQVQVQGMGTGAFTTGHFSLSAFTLLGLSSYLTPRCTAPQ